MRADIIVDKYDLQVREYGAYRPEFARQARRNNFERARRMELEKADRERQEAIAAAEMEARAQEMKARYKEVPVSCFAAKLVDCKSVIQFVAGFHGVSPDDITGQLRARKLVEARVDAICLCKCKFPHLSLPHIGNRFGGRDHTTVLYSLRKCGWTGSNWRSGKPELSDPLLWGEYLKRSQTWG